MFGNIPNRFEKITTGSGDVKISGSRCLGVRVDDVTSGGNLTLFYGDGSTILFKGCTAGETIVGQFEGVDDSGTTVDELTALVRV